MSFGFGFALPHWQTLSGGFNPSALFVGGTAGAWYDPSDSTTLFEDTAGTTPSPTPGGGALSVVGLMLDKSQGLVLGSELVTNGDFATASSWATGGAWVISGGAASITASAASLSQSTLAAVAGRTYQVTFTISAFSSGGVRVEFGGVNGTSRNAAGTYTQYITASSTAFLVISPTATSTLSIDNISIRELPGNHAISYNTTTARPELSARVNLLTYSEEFDNGAWKNLVTLTGALPTRTASAGPDPLGGTTADRLQFSRTLSGFGERSAIMSGDATFVLGIQYTTSFYAKSYSGSNQEINLLLNANGVVLQTFTVTSSWQRFTYTFTSGATFTASGSAFRIGLIDAASSALTSDVLLWGADLRPTNIGANVPAYQRIADQYTYDSSGFPRYLVFNGTASGMYTPANLNLSGTDKATVFAGVRKQSDAQQIITELSASIANAGSFAITNGNLGVVSNVYGFVLDGSAISTFGASTYSAPTSNVLSCVYDIAGAARATEIFPRVNGAIPTLTGYDAASAGTGNFGSYPLNIGVRNAQGGAPTTLFFNGNIYSLIVVGAASTAAQISSTESWINVKEGGVY